MTHSLDPAALLGDVGWLRALAARLVHDRDDGDDLAQDALVTAWRKGPEARASLRPWLRKVARDGARMFRRGRARRTAREQLVAVAEPGAVRGPEQLLAEAELHQALVAAVLALDEPYRRTILARFVDGQAAVAIAEREGVAAGTVRWRQAEGLRRLRVALDAPRPRRGRGLLAVGLWRRSTVARGVAVAVVVAVLALVVIATTRGRPPGHRAAPPTPPLTARLDEPRAARAVGAVAATPSAWAAAQAGTVPVTGVVVDVAGAPIAGAEVTLDPSVALNAAPIQRTVSDADGRFAFAPSWHEVAVVAARAPGHADASQLVDPRGRRGAATDELRLTLGDCAHRVEGTVRDAGGGPVADASIRRLVPGAGGRYQPAIVGDRDGRFALCLSPGVSSLVIGAPGYESVVRDVVAHRVQGLDVALVPEARVTGQVVDAATGAAVIGAQVTMWPALRLAGGPAERSAVTGVDGRFTVDGLAAGRFQLTAWAADHGSAIVDDVIVLPAIDGAELRVALAPATTASGVIVADGQPVVGAEVWLERGSGVPRVASGHAISGADGRFTLARVPAEAGLIVVVRDHVVRGPVTVDATGVTPLTVEVERPAEITGTVVRDGRAVADAELWLARPGPPLRARADGRGRFRFAVPPGAYQLGAAGPDGFTPRLIAVDAPTAAPITVELDGGAAIRGQVVDDRGRAVVGVTVSAFELDSDDRGEGMTAVDGSFRIAALAGGRYRLRVDPFRGAPTPLAWLDGPPAQVTLADGRAEAGPLVLRVDPAAGAIAGAVIDAAGAPVADAYVRLGPAMAGGGLVARSDRDGRFTLATRGPGPFAIDAGVAGGPTAIARAVAPGRRDVILRVATPGAVLGRLAGDGATAWLAPIDHGGVGPGAPARRTVVVDGRFAFEAVAPGIHRLTVVGVGGPVATRTLEVHAGATTDVGLAAVATRRRSGLVTAFGTGAPVAGVACVAAPALGDARPPGLARVTVGAVITDERGRFTLEAAPDGAAIVSCDATSRHSGGAVIVDGDQPLDVVVVAGAAPVAARLGFQLDRDRVTPVVAALEPDAPAGLAVGDRVVAVDDVAVEHLGVEAVYGLLAGRAYGTSIRVRVARGAARLDVEVRAAVP